MRAGDQVERLVMLPFSLGCDSDACVALGKKKHQLQPNKNKTDHYHVATQDHHHHPITKMVDMKGERRRRGKGGMMRRLRNILSQKSSVFHRLILTTFSHLFVHKEEEEVEEEEMEIGLPTDVKHVTHIGIGWDGSTTINHPDADAVKGKERWEENAAEMSFHASSISVTQFELAMAAQAAAPPSPPPDAS